MPTLSSRLRVCYNKDLSLLVAASICIAGVVPIIASGQAGKTKQGATIIPQKTVALAVSAKEEGGLIDTLHLGNGADEKAHGLVAHLSDTITGGLDEPARRLLPQNPPTWEGGNLGFMMKVDPERTNYLTIKLWGSDITQNRLKLFCEGKQVGYHHLGDVDLLDFGSDAPAYNGRFFYNTTPLPLAITKGRTLLHLEIRSIGRIWGYGTTFEQYQKPLTEPTRGIYCLYTHNDGYFTPPTTEKQGTAPLKPPVREHPGPEILDQVKARVNGEIDRQLRQNRPLNQMQTQFLARAYHIRWTHAYQNPQVVRVVGQGLDNLFLAYRKNPKLAESEPSTYNPDWFGLGPAGDTIRLMAEPLRPDLETKLFDQSGKQWTRRTAWVEMLRASRDWHRKNRREYTNQSMIVDMYVYAANRGIAAIDPTHALPEEQTLHYLYQAVGLEPWLGSDTEQGPEKPLGDQYFELTRKGLTRELGFVGYYGEVLDWVAQIYDVTRGSGRPDGDPRRDVTSEPGDAKIKAQLERIIHARSVFRYPMLDADGNRAMRIETIVGWRDAHYPGDIVYGERPAWDGAALYALAATLDPLSVGSAQQMFADNQFFASLEESLKNPILRVTAGLMSAPDDYERLRAHAESNLRLPMTHGQPDFAFADEEDGVVAIKNGDEILYASLYWRARYAINDLARIHYITPRYDRIAIVHQKSEFIPSGETYTVPDWIDQGFAWNSHHYPGDLHQALAGEKQPIAQIPPGVKFKPGEENAYAGKAEFYTCRYGDYLIGMNCTTTKTFSLAVPTGVTRTLDLVSRQTLIPANGALPVKPLSTIVLSLGKKSAQPKSETAHAHVVQNAPDFTPVSDQIEQWIAKGYYRGAALLVARYDKQNDHVVYEHYFGANKPETVIYIASAGKWLAAATIASVVDSGKLGWDDPVSKWLPEFKDTRGRATLRQLLSHTSGFPDYQPRDQRPDNYQTLTESVTHIVPLPLDDPPGARFHYGGLAMQVAGRMAELATHKEWETLFQKRIARSCGMTSTHFTPVDPTGGHNPMLGGGARTTLRDYGNFLSMIAHDGVYKGHRLLSKKAIEEMQADQVRGAKVEAGKEFVEQVRGEKHNGIYGLGEWREQLDESRQAIQLSSPSWAGAYPWIDKQHHLYGFFLAHVDTTSSTVPHDHFDSFRTSPLLAPLIANILNEDKRL